MRHGITRIDRIEDYRLFDTIIDTRSPAEFAEDHIPGAINCPVLDDQQRIEVGTLYKQHSPFAAKKIGAAYVAENIAHHLRHSFRDHPQNWRPLIVCWRGGQRSGAMTLILRRVGWDAQQLEGGYKYYRKLVVDTLAEIPARLAFTILCGATGSGKSRLLQALAQQGEQVLDLEELACHKGSVLGVLPDAAQPSQKMFETKLLLALAGLDPQRPVYAEAESRKIGSIHLPTALLEAMRRSPCVNIEATLEARVDFLLRDYSYFLEAPAWLNTRLDDLRHLQSKETIERWHEFTRTADWRTLVGELLDLHYDPLYRRSQNNNFTGLDKPHTFLASDLNPAALAVLAQQIVSRSPTPGIKPQTQLVQAPAKA
jgi:tRNA 2-selenouridine synthase